MYNPFSHLTPSQTWKEHPKPSEDWGGVDYGMPVGTPLPIVPGVLEWVTPFTLIKPKWYNRGLGRAAAYRRPDGTRTVFGHNSKHDGLQVYSGNTGTSTGPHVHTHDVLPDGVTRVPPFSTIRQGRNTMQFYRIKDANGAGKHLYILLDNFLYREFTTAAPNNFVAQFGTPADVSANFIAGWKAQVDRNVAALTAGGGTLPMNASGLITLTPVDSQG
jgi:hypothetical protein